MSFDAKYSLTRFKISFRSGFSWSLQILYSLLYASALIYIKATTPTRLVHESVTVLQSLPQMKRTLCWSLCFRWRECLASLLHSATRKRLDDACGSRAEKDAVKSWNSSGAAALLLLHHMLFHFHFESCGFGTQRRSQTRIGWEWAELEREIIHWIPLWTKSSIFGRFWRLWLIRIDESEINRLNLWECVVREFANEK